MAYATGYEGGYGDTLGPADLLVEVAFATDPGATPAWTDISAYLEGELSTFRGRSMETERYRTGTLDLTLQNEDRRFDPANTASPYYPNVVPMRRIRVRASYNAATYDVFSGYIDSWDQSYEHPQVAHCRVSASDLFKVLNQIEMPGSAYEVEVRADAPFAWYRLGDPQDTTTLRDSAGNNHLPIENSPELGVPGLTVRDSDTAALFDTAARGAQRTGNATVTGPPFTVELMFQTDGAPSGVGIIGEVSTSYTFAGVPSSGWSVERDIGTDDIRFTVLPLGGTPTVVGVTGDAFDGSPHHIAFSWAADGTLKGYFDGVEQGSGSVAAGGGFSSPVTTILGAGRGTTTGVEAVVGTYDEIAVYNTVLSPARVAAHASARAVAWAGDLSGARINRILDAAGIPAADRSIDTGVAVLQGSDVGGTALAMLQAVEETEQGRLFITTDGKVRFISREAIIKSPYTVTQATFGDSGAELEYGDLKYRYDDTTIVNEVTVSRSDGVAQTVKDTASQTKYLRRSMVLAGLLHASDQTSTDLANWKLGHYKEPILRATQLRLEPDAGNESTHYPQVLGRELVDRVTVKRRPQSVGAAIDQETHIESIGHRVGAVTWKTDWNLSPADTVPIGVWDQATALWDVAKWGM